MNILIVKLSSLGDVIQTMPVVADVLRQHPHAQIDWVVEEAFAPLVARVQGVRRVIPIALRRWRKRGWWQTAVRQERSAFKAQLQQDAYDVVMDGQGLIKSALVARLARLTAGARMGSFANKSKACGYEWPVKFLLPHNQTMPKRIHAVARTRLLAAKLLGYENAWAQHAPHVRFKPRSSAEIAELTTAMSGAVVSEYISPAAGRVWLAHGTTRADNAWPRADWLALAQRIVDSGQALVLAHSNAAELAFCDDVHAALPAGAVAVLPRKSLADLLDDMAQCAGVIGVDSGLSHLAVALGLAHVQIFQHDRAWRAGPVGCAYQLSVGGLHCPDVDEVWQTWGRVQSARFVKTNRLCM